MNYEEKVKLAEDPNTPIHVLEKLSKDEYWHIRCRVAQNPNTPMGCLTALIADAEVEVRKAAMENYERRRDELQRESQLVSKL